MADSVWAYPGGGGDFEMRALLSVEGGAESTEREYLEMRFDGYYDPTYLTAYRKIAAGDPDAKPIPYGVPKNGWFPETTHRPFKNLKLIAQRLPHDFSHWQPQMEGP